MSNTNKASKSIFAMIIFGFGSKILGFLRETLIGQKFGAGIESDTFFVALTATALITSLIGGAISTTMIPILTEIEAKEGKEGKIKRTNNILNLLLVISFVLVILLLIGAPYVVKIFARNFQGKQFQLAVILIRIGSPVIIFTTIVSVFRGFLQSELMFIESAAANFPFNIVYIVFLIFLSNTFGIKGLMVASVLAVISQIALQIPSLWKSRYRYSFEFNIRDRYYKKLLYLTGPVFIGVTINDLNIIINRVFASGLVEGSISALNYANKLNALILGIFVTAITTVIFPLLSKASNENNTKKVINIMDRGINLILIITIPSTLGLLLLSNPIVQVAFERGAFTTTATTMTSQALMAYSLSLLFMGLRLMVTRVYFSLEDSRTPMINGVLSIILNVILNLVLVRYLAHVGLALGTSIATIISTLILLYKLNKKIGPLDFNSYTRYGLKIVIASILMGISAYLVYSGLYSILGVSGVNNLISLVVAIGSGAIIYGILCYIFKVEEVRDIIHKALEVMNRLF